LRKAGKAAVGQAFRQSRADKICAADNQYIHFSTLQKVWVLISIALRHCFSDFPHEPGKCVEWNFQGHTY
jgi:hypothetical protein